MAAGPFSASFCFKPTVIGSITVGCSNQHKRPHSLLVFKLKPIVMCRCSSHANSAPITTTVGTLLPPTPTTLVQRQKRTTTASPYKMALSQELASQQQSLATLLLLISHFGLSN